MSERSRLRIVPLTVAAANRIVRRLHRHHGPVPAGLAAFAVGVVDESGRLCGAAVVGRPGNRNNDDLFTAEVLRVATDGTPNTPSALYGATVRAAAAMGFARVITYTLDVESGASLRGAGWVRDGDGIVSKWAKYDRKGGSYGQVQPRDHFDMTKVRWVKTLKSKPDAGDRSLAAKDDAPTGRATLGLEAA